MQYCNTDPFSGKRTGRAVQRYSLYVVQNPPAKPLSQEEMDLKYMAFRTCRTWHPDYEKARRSSGYRRNQVQPDQQQRMFWWMQFLCADVSSGKDCADEKS